MKTAARLLALAAAALLTFVPSVRSQFTPVVTTLHTFNQTDGYHPNAQGSDGDFSARPSTAAANYAPSVFVTTVDLSLLSPINTRNIAAGSTVPLEYTADSTTQLSQVTFYADGQPIASFDGSGNPPGSAAPSSRATRRDASGALSGGLFQASYTLPGEDKVVNLIAVALDSLGQSTASSVASVHSTISDHAPPVVSLGGIASGMYFQIGSTTTVIVDASVAKAATGTRRAGPARADAADGGTLALLEYYLNGAKIAQATQPPYSFNFTPPSAGTYVLHAVATDDTGLATVSTPVVVHAGEPPTVSLTAGDGVVLEGAAKGSVVFTRTGDAGAAMTVSYKIKGSAKAGVDFKMPTGTLTIPAGSAKAKLKLKTLAGGAFDGTRVAKVVLLTPADGSYASGAQAVAKIKFVAAP